MNEVLLWLALILLCLTAALGVATLILVTRHGKKTEETLREELRLAREEARLSARDLREEVTKGIGLLGETLSRHLEGLATGQQGYLRDMTARLEDLSRSNREALDRIRDTFDGGLRELREGNERKLEEMRRTVDEKLHETLERRLGESFRLVSDRLEAVHKGLGEMQNLAAGVGDLKRVLSNVKTRGTWGEVQLGAILEQILTPSQYAKNVRVRPGSAETVEFAVRLPGPADDPNACLWLPIDAKLPQEDYLRLQEAAERGDGEALQRASEALARVVRGAAKDIRDKYVHPPHTTDFGIMFLPTEGLYAEVLRQDGLVEELIGTYRVVAAGPTTLAAVLSSLRMGFQTLAVERRASEVWKVLGAVKTEFRRFGEFLDKMRRQLDTARNTLDEGGTRARALERKLKDVSELPDDEARQVLE